MAPKYFINQTHLKSFNADTSSLDAAAPSLTYPLPVGVYILQPFCRIFLAALLSLPPLLAKSARNIPPQSADVINLPYMCVHCTVLWCAPNGTRYHRGAKMKKRTEDVEIRLPPLNSVPSKMTNLVLTRELRVYKSSFNCCAKHVDSIRTSGRYTSAWSEILGGGAAEVLKLLQ